MATKLNEITTGYDKFVDNQVLTKDQLNKFINFFDDQVRMSRVFLHGVGIVCGFNLGVNSENQQITISQGVGITTDGDLLKLRKNIPGKTEKTIDIGEITYTHYKVFEDNFANYSFFRNTKNSGSGVKEIPIKLWELFDSEENNSKKIVDFPNLKEMVVLLYLEDYSKEGDLCTSIDCDNQGIEQVARLRILLVHKNDAEYIAANDQLFSKYNIIDNYFDIPEIAVQRVVLNSVNSRTYNEIKRAYYQAISGTNLVSQLKTGIVSIFTHFEPIIQTGISAKKQKEALSKLHAIANFSPYKIPFDIQYRYDCLKDAVDTYNEIKELLLCLKQECNPKITAFPKHLLLGKIDEINEPVKHLRHEFYKSPGLSSCDNKVNRARLLIKRLFEILTGFETRKGEIKITPSNKLTPLSNRSLPFYFDVSPSFLQSWNFDKTKRNKWDTNLSYHTKYLAQTPGVQEPLAYNTDSFDFFRIEGHQGQNYKTALEKIDDLKKIYGLAFDVKALSVNINRQELNTDDYECEFEDLNVLLQAWKAEQDCVLAEVSKFFSSFSTTQPGFNEKEPELGVKTETPLSANTIANSAATKKTFQPEIGKTGAKQSNLYQPVYHVNKVVSENLNTKTDTLGYEMKKAIELNKNGSVNDIVATVKKNISGKLNNDKWNNQPEIKTAVIDNSVELMAYSHLLSQRMPGAVSFVDTTKVNEYQLSLDELCQFLKKFKSNYEKVELNVAVKAFVGTLINQLSGVCCSGKKLKILLEEINKRKESILLRLQLSAFVEKHPGLEHKAGVEPGGTFVLVYLNKEKQLAGKDKQEFANIANEKPLAENMGSPLLKSETPTLSTPLFFKSPKIETVETVAGKITTSPVFHMERFNPEPDLANNTVVADFALPYMCCSDCAPMNFIVQKKPASMILETDHYCLGQDTNTIGFEVSPADGTIESDPAVEGIQIEGKTLSVVEDLFPAEMLGKPISFTVNNQLTEAVLAVYKGINVDFKVPESPTKETKVTFLPEGNIDGASFLWEFGDGETDTVRNPTHEYKLPVNEENKVTVRLSVLAPNGICRKTVEHDIFFIEEKTIVEFSPDVFCENDKGVYNFKVTPKGADVEIKGPGVGKNADGFIFVPADAKTVGEITFEYSAEPGQQTVKIEPAPVASFVHKQEGNLLVLTNTSTNASSFTWIINGKKKEVATFDPIEIKLTETGPKRWQVRLVANGASVCNPSRTKLEVITTTFVPDQPVLTCIELTTKNIQADLEKLQTLNLPTNNLVAPIWNKTAALFGGTSQFKTGVLDKQDDYLSGKNNNLLVGKFAELIQSTANMIVEVDKITQKTVYNRLIQIFELQLKLFYNVLGCQSPDAIDKGAEFINTVFNAIISSLQLLKEMKVLLPDTLREFVKEYQIKVADLTFISDHIKQITSNKLI